MPMIDARQQFLCEDCNARETNNATARVAMIGSCSACGKKHVGLIPFRPEKFPASNI